MMTFDEYMREIVAEMSRKSVNIGKAYAQHKSSVGSNRECLVAKFLREHLPKRFGVSTGLIISHDGYCSNEADLVVFDRANNSPLYPGFGKELWPVEGIYALIEVKSQLSPRDLNNAISKLRKFKNLQRSFPPVKDEPRIADSLAVLWSFDSSSPETLKKNLESAIKEVPKKERPDFIIVPGKLVAKLGSYLEIVRIGQPNSLYRNRLVEQYGKNLDFLSSDEMEVYSLGDNSLMIWWVWFDSWLRHAGERFYDPLKYLPENKIWGKRV